MSLGLLSLIVLGLAVLGFLAGRRRALALAQGDARRLHSLPGYYGWQVFLFTAVPALALMLIWAVAQPSVVDARVAAELSVAEGGSLELLMNDVRRVAEGLNRLPAASDDLTTLKTQLSDAGVALGGELRPEVLTAARDYHAASASLRLVLTGLVALVALAGFAFALARITPEQRARNLVEHFVLALLIGCALVAVATTFGIIASLVSESWNFFKLYPATDFLFSTEWNPKFGGGSSLGLWPLVWGTIYVSLISLAVAVPLGLLAAIYLSEYAGPKTRAIVKPLLEILAGIPSIVYGLFALITVGPLLRDWFAMPMGWGDSSSSVMTAGLVMGIMLIPYVSSLSDDIINAVPQAMRDGSYGIGANQSETIKRVVIPAALPGIVGAVLLAASRAIGETMIVVMGAGAAAKLSLNPFEAMTTVTVKIVSQLTGDTEFASPETLVAFALGLTLFCFTLALNVVALVIVRKYREQYE